MNIVMRKLRILLVLPDYFRSKNTIVAKKSQLFWGNSFANKVRKVAELRESPTGTILYQMTDSELKPFLVEEDWDPYLKDMYHRQLQKWLWNHVVFDGFGQMIGIHDQGRIIYHKQSWEKEMELFSKVWL